MNLYKLRDYLSIYIYICMYIIYIYTYNHFPNEPLQTQGVSIWYLVIIRFTWNQLGNAVQGGRSGPRSTLPVARKRRAKELHLPPASASSGASEAWRWPCRMVPPSDVCWFINPMNYSYLRIINHSDIGIMCTNLFVFKGLKPPTYD